MLNMGDKLVEEGKFDDAFKIYNDILKADPNYAFAYIGLSYANINKKDYEMAIKTAKLAITLDPNLSAGHNNLGYGYYRKGLVSKDVSLHEAAIKEFNEALRLDTNNDKAIKNKKGAELSLGDILVVQGKFDHACNIYNGILKADPNYAPAYIGLSYANINKKDYDMTIINAKQAVNLDPDLSGGHNNLGYGYYMKGRALKNVSYLEDAIKEFNEALRLNPNSNNAILNKRSAECELDEYRKNPQASDTANAQQNQSVIYKETIREIVKIPCPYCGFLVENTMSRCPSCGAPQKR